VRVPRRRGNNRVKTGELIKARTTFLVPLIWHPSAGSLVSVTQKENALLLFHLMGKMMYNKSSSGSISLIPILM
jgi:hypothetical protein